MSTRHPNLQLEAREPGRVVGRRAEEIARCPMGRAALGVDKPDTVGHPESRCHTAWWRIGGWAGGRVGGRKGRWKGRGRGRAGE